MQKQDVDRLTSEELVTTTDLKSLIQGYLLNYKTEGKSPATRAIYETVLKNFPWYCEQNDFPSVRRISSMHVRHFLWYLSIESNRWGSSNAATNKTVKHLLIFINL